MSRRKLLAAALVTLVVYGCGEQHFERDRNYRNILLITVDTTRADHLGCYGNPLPITPNIDALAERGTIFENAYAPMPQTLPAHATLFTGLNPRQHGALENAYMLPARVDTMAELLQAEGFRTGAFVAALVLSPFTGIGQGFEEYDIPSEARYGKIKKVVRRPAEDVTEAALGWARKLDPSRRFLLWAHYYDPHEPFNPPGHARVQVPRSAVAAWVQTRGSKIQHTRLTTDELVDYWHGYAAEMRSMDEQIGRLLEGLSDLGLLEDTYVVLVGDHGEGLYEHGERGHGVNLYEELMRVPFVVWDPDGEFAGGRIRTPVTLADAFPTIMELALGRPFEGPVSGSSLAASLRAGSEPESRPIFVERPHFSRERLRSGKKTPERHLWGVMVAVIEGGYKLIRRPARPDVLFDLERDPQELTDVAPQETERIHELRSLLDDWVFRHPTPEPGVKPETPQEQIEALKALGYIDSEDGP